MAVELIAGLGLFKSMFDAAKGLKDINDAAIRNAAVIELQEKILAAREQQSALAERVGDLEAQVAEFEAWDAEKQRYELKEFKSGQFAYPLKAEVAGGEPAHMLCANCYSKNQKSILQTEVRDPGRHEVTFCQNCGNELFSPDSGGRSGKHPAVKSREGSWNRARRRR